MTEIIPPLQNNNDYNGFAGKCQNSNLCFEAIAGVPEDQPRTVPSGLNRGSFSR